MNGSSSSPSSPATSMNFSWCAWAACTTCPWTAIRRSTTKPACRPRSSWRRSTTAVEPLYKKRDRYFREVESALRSRGIADMKIDELQGDDAVFVYDYWRSCVLPVLSPQIVDDHHPFPLCGQQSALCGGGTAKEKAHHSRPDPHARGAAAGFVPARSGHSLCAPGGHRLPLCRRSLPPPTRCFRAISSALPATPISAPRTKNSPPPAISARK